MNMGNSGEISNYMHKHANHKWTEMMIFILTSMWSLSHATSHSFLLCNFPRMALNFSLLQAPCWFYLYLGSSLSGISLSTQIQRCLLLKQEKDPLRVILGHSHFSLASLMTWYSCFHLFLCSNLEWKNYIIVA